MNECSAYVGLDVHKDTIAVAVALPGRGEPVYRGEVKTQRVESPGNPGRFSPTLSATAPRASPSSASDELACALSDNDAARQLNEAREQLFTSSPRWWTNQYRVALAALAYTLLETMRRTALRGTALARAQCRTIRLRLVKLGAVVTRNTRTVAVRLSITCPDQTVFRLLVHRLTAG